jgi:Spy/CpxP family protein refolding chaperone
MKKMIAALIATIFLVSLLGCAAQTAESKAKWDEQTQKTLQAQKDEDRQRRIIKGVSAETAQ